MSLSSTVKNTVWLALVAILFAPATFAQKLYGKGVNDLYAARVRGLLREPHANYGANFSPIDVDKYVRQIVEVSSSTRPLADVIANLKQDPKFSDLLEVNNEIAELLQILRIMGVNSIVYIESEYFDDIHERSRTYQDFADGYPAGKILDVNMSQDGFYMVRLQTKSKSDWWPVYRLRVHNDDLDYYERLGESFYNSIKQRPEDPILRSHPRANLLNLSSPYYLPSGRSLQTQGIKPEIQIEDTLTKR